MSDEENFNYIKNSYLQAFKNNLNSTTKFTLEYEINSLKCELEIFLIGAIDDEKTLEKVVANLVLYNNIMYDKKYLLNDITILLQTSSNNDENEEEKVMNVLKKIHSINNDFTYSKLLDRLVVKEDLIEEEKLKKAIDWLVHLEKAECCVCNDEINDNLKTECGHFICRICIEQVESKCPVCRKFYIGDEMFVDDLEEDVIIYN